MAWFKFFSWTRQRQDEYNNNRIVSSSDNSQSDIYASNINLLNDNNESLSSVLVQDPDWQVTNNRYDGKTLQRIDENGKLEYKTEFINDEYDIKSIFENFKIIDNKLLWQKVITLNNDKIILEFTNLTDNKQLQQIYKVYQNENEYNCDLELLSAQYLQENFQLVIKNETNFWNKILNSKYSFLSVMTFLNLSLGTLSLFNAKNNFHKENPFTNLFNNWKDGVVSITSGFTEINLSYLNYKIINFNTKWKYLPFSLVSATVGVWQSFLDLYISEKNFDLTYFTNATGVNFSTNLIEELIFVKVAQPLIKELWEKFKNKKYWKSLGCGIVICCLVFLSSLENVVSGLYSEKKAINLENIEKALPLALLCTIVENGISSPYFFYFDLFLPKIKDFICATSDIVETELLEKFNECESKETRTENLLKKFDILLSSVSKVQEQTPTNENEELLDIISQSNDISFANSSTDSSLII